MLELAEWQKLTKEWAQALNKAKIKEAVIADRMNSFLKGNGCLPDMADLKEVDALWDLHAQKRNALNLYVASVVEEFNSKS